MNVPEWVNGVSNVQGMLDHLLNPGKVQRSKIGKRKLRLFACGRCRLIWEGLEDPRLRAAVEMAEQVADGLSPVDRMEPFVLEVARVSQELNSKSGYLYQSTAAGCVTSCLEPIASDAARNAEMSPLPLIGTWAEHSRDIVATQCRLVRDIFGNPFSPVSVDPGWITSTVVSLARQMYESRDFSIMPILSDALQDAGCANADILDHCRSEGPHVRGCWVIDLILGKE